MKKILNTIILIVLVFTFTTPVYAATYTLYDGRISATNGLNVRKGASSNTPIVGFLNHNARFSYRDSNVISSSDKNDSCTSKKWIYVSSINGYACSTYVTVMGTSVANDYSDSEMAKMTEAEFDVYLNSQGFPDSYKTKLKTLHAKHPSWVFKGVKSKYNWNTAISEESALGRSLYQVTSSGFNSGYQGYLSTASGAYDWEKDSFRPQDSSTWYQANNETIGYYLDPRNFLTESSIFMFEDLLYYSNYQNQGLVENILNSSAMKPYAPHFINAAKTHNVSPIYLAALVRQEVGLDGTPKQITGTATCNGTNDYYGYYNFYNIGANSGVDPACNGLVYAKKVGWSSPEKSIVGGAGWIVNGYINQGQYTRYFQKWNTSPTTSNGVWHQYMTDVTAVSKSSSSTSSSYNNMGVLEIPFIFTIPIYDGIPASTSLPGLGSPNNWLKELKVDGATVSNFNGNTTNYTLNVNNKSSITIAATAVSTKSTISGTGIVNLKAGVNTATVIVKAGNGSTKNYTVTINNKKDSSIAEPSITDVISKANYKYDNNYLWGITLGSGVSTLSNNLLKQNNYATVNIKNSGGSNKIDGTVVTGDKITITSNDETKTYEVVIYGDLNGSGSTDVNDLLAMQKHILGYTKLVGAKLKAADTNKDGKVDVRDLLAIQKQILKYANISQN